MLRTRGMKNQPLFSTKDKSEKLKCPSAAFLFDALRVKCAPNLNGHVQHLSDNKTGF